MGGCVKLPPLRERSDRLGLARELLRDQSIGHTLAPSGEAWVLDHDWPGNVRELKVALADGLALAGDEPIERAHLPEPLLDLRAAQPTGASRRATLLALAQAAVGRANGNVSEAARALGVARSTLYRMLGT